LQVLGDLPVDALPGVGWALKNKLAELGITQCRQVRHSYFYLFWNLCVCCSCFTHDISVGWAPNSKLAELSITKCRQVRQECTPSLCSCLHCGCSSKELLMCKLGTYAKQLLVS
jgi:hypothetical protein